MPADGSVASGTSSVDESALTGESMPRTKEEGDLVLAGSINTEAVLRVKVEKPAEDKPAEDVKPADEKPAETPKV